MTIEAVNFLKSLIRVPSENDNELEVAQIIGNLLSEYDIPYDLIEYAPGRSNLVATIQNGKGKVVGLSGHLDVVSAGDHTQWKYPPFEAVEKDGVLWGRGASDMKTGLAALIMAFIRLHQSKQFKGTIKLLCTVGEEIGELGANQLENLGYANDLDALLIAEPSNIGVMYAHKGSLNYTISAKGVAAHSSTPEQGKNAIHHLIFAMDNIQKAMNDRSKQKGNKVLGHTFNNFTLISGGTQINSLPDSAICQGNARTVPEFDNKEVITLIQDTLHQINEEYGYDLSVEVTANQPAVESDNNSELIQTILEVVNASQTVNLSTLLEQMNDALYENEGKIDVALYTTAMGGLIQPIVASGTTDAAQFLKNNKQIELAVYGPGMPMLNHKINERVPIRQYLDFIAIYEQILKKYMA